VYPSARSKLTGLLVAAVSVAAITAVIFPSRHVVPAVSTGVLYLLGVLLVSTYWGLALGLVTSLASAAAFNFFHIPPTGHFSIAHTENWVALGVYFVAAVVTSTLATAARARAVEADSRRREADLAAELARVVLGAPELDRALPEAAARIGDTVGADGVRLELGWVDGTDDEQAIPLVDDGRRVGTLLVPRDAPAQLRDRPRAARGAAAHRASHGRGAAHAAGRGGRRGQGLPPQAVPLLEAVEQRATAYGVPVDSRIERGRDRQ
jgi:two-component system sensor histidine kinase KdpD